MLTNNKSTLPVSLIVRLRTGLSIGILVSKAYNNSHILFCFSERNWLGFIANDLSNRNRISHDCLGDISTYFYF